MSSDVSEPVATASDSGRSGARASAPIGVERFSELLGAIYDAALDSTAWIGCLEQLRREFDGNYTAIIVRPGSEDDLGLIVSAAGDHRVVPPDNPLIELSPFSDMPADRVMTVGDVMTDADWRTSHYYREWCAPRDVHYVLALDIGTRDGGIYGFRVTRPESATPFSPRDRDLCRQLLPHFKRALNLHLSVSKERKIGALYSHSMGKLMVASIVLDENGDVLESNGLAQAVLELKDGLRLAGNRLEATYAVENRKLQQLLRDALAHKSAAGAGETAALSISRPSGKVAWGLMIQPISPDEWTKGRHHRPSVAIFVRDAESHAHPPVKLAQQLFSLTPAETALAIELANGLSLEEAAEALNIRRNTARAHLRSIFSKTGVRRQTELVRIFLNSVAWLGARE